MHTQVHIDVLAGTVRTGDTADTVKTSSSSDTSSLTHHTSKLTVSVSGNIDKNPQLMHLQIIRDHSFLRAAEF